MPRQPNLTVDNVFNKGLITEASGLNFPENACTETENCIFNLTGSVSRRLGFDFETNHSIEQLDRSNGVILSFVWKNPNGSASTNLLVTQIGAILYFWNTSYPVSDQLILDNIDLNDFLPSASTNNPANNECQFAVGNGKLFVVHPHCDAFQVTFDESAQTFSTTEIDLKIRDFEGVDDSLAVDARPTATMGTITATHHYNLLNQGWNATNLAAWDTARSDLPSNVDVMWTFKNSSDAFDASTVPNVMSGNSPAPKGHFIFSVFDQDRSTASGIGGITSVTTDKNRASTVAFFAGRVFYSGIQYQGFNSKIYFSQLIESDTQLGKCYQINDPSAENVFDLLPTDGGVIAIRDAGTILKLFPVDSGLAVFATNGVWYITGSTGLGFTASDYSISKISSVPCLTASSFVDVAGFPMWWNLDGIYVLGSGGQGSVGIQVQSATETTIASFYQSLPPATKRNCKGVYNRLNRVVQWMYTTEEVGDINAQYNFDHILNFDTRTQAFYEWEFDADHDVKLNGAFVIEGTAGVTKVLNVVDGSGNQVINQATDDVVVYDLGNAISSPVFKYLVSYNDGDDQFTIAEATNTGYVDWEQYDDVGIDYESYFVSGYKIRGNAMMDAQVGYAGMYANAGSRYIIQGLWDYANTDTGRRWSNPQTMDMTSIVNKDIVFKRPKIRGRGKALQIKVKSDTGYPFTIVGWSLLTSSNSSS